MSTTIPATTKALVIRAKGEIELKASVPTPRLRDDYLLVRTTALALNPTDWKAADLVMGGNTVGARVGCDYAGVVVAVGDKVTQPFKVGDRIAGGVHGSNQSEHEDGAFAEYIAAKPDLAFKIPDFMSNEEAASLPLGLTTVGQGFFQGLKLNTPEDPLKTPENILIYGGATATGQLGIQYAKLAGYRVLTTASAKHTEHLKSLGAAEVIDYHDTDAALANIKAALHGEALRYAWDCVSLDETGEFCAKALALTPQSAAAGPGSLHYYCLLWVDMDKVKAVDARIEGDLTFYYTAFGEPFEKWQKFPANLEHLEFARQFWESARKLIDAGKIKPAQTFANRGGSGFEGVLVGLKELKENKVSGGKLVYTISQ